MRLYDPSLMIGVAAASASKLAILIAGVEELMAGSMSMAVGEYVSVSAQRDSEQATSSSNSKSSPTNRELS